MHSLRCRTGEREAGNGKSLQTDTVSKKKDIFFTISLSVQTQFFLPAADNISDVCIYNLFGLFCFCYTFVSGFLIPPLPLQKIIIPLYSMMLKLSVAVSSFLTESLVC